MKVPNYLDTTDETGEWYTFIPNATLVEIKALRERNLAQTELISA